MLIFPTWMHGPLAFVLPSMWKVNGCIGQAQKLLVPEIIRRKAIDRI